MVGQQVFQHVFLTRAPFAPPCYHSFQALPLPLGSRFNLVSSSREMGPGRPLRLTIAFQPTAPKASKNSCISQYNIYMQRILALQNKRFTAAGV